MFLKFTAIIVSSLIFLLLGSQITDDQKLLQGLWQAESIKSGGKDVSPEAAKSMKFVFDGDKLIVSGNFGKDSKEECAYKIDSAKSPKHLDILPPSQSEPVLAIYELNNDELKVCVRRSPKAERPKSFETDSDENLTFVVFKRQK